MPGRALPESQVLRRVFGSWSIEIPTSFAETFVYQDGYWHAYDEHRSVSMSSLLITDGDRPVSLPELAALLPPMEGAPIEDLPAGLVGHAAIAPAIEPARATTMLAGVLAIHGRVLLVTITADDVDWMRGVWTSIRSYRVPARHMH